ncbi:cell division protein SepF [Acaryochloris marina]|uniref:Cell division protein SepF n=1 Tax=Acaryochloris marina (strain MBIC 11017) TaxID=329726 RepID=A8ZQ90_ACAM1|nr:cell division protein SepF [Acaryochloris marina]ABW33075.1 conserved hypothetical protein [Acaryochloris marina MBIC11017]
MDNLLSFQGVSPHKIRVYHPKSFEDAEEAINTMRTDDMLLVNLVAVKPTLAQRLADYFAGSTFALSGEYIEIGKKVFLLAPPSFSVKRMMASA